MDNKVIQVNCVSKKFAEAVVIDQITMSMEEGKIYGLIGRNGSGKTVLMKLICGFLKPTEGEVLIKGKQVYKSEEVLEEIGLIIESPGFLPNYSGYKNLKLLAMIRNRISPKEIREVMELVGLDPDAKKKVGKYSLGMKQRLGIAQAIMENPQILILDEPMNGLDNEGVVQMRELFLTLAAQGKTILLASHMKEDIQLLCDEIYTLDKGRVVHHEVKER